MKLRKEPVLAGLTFALAVWVGRGYLGEPQHNSRYQAQTASYEAVAVVATPLAPEAGGAIRRRSFCTEPAETRPLPPRELDMPPLPPLPVAPLPLDPGLDLRRLWLQQIDGRTVEGVSLETPPESTGDPTANAEPGAGADNLAGSRAEREERAARIYDRVYVNGLRAPFFGTIENEGLDLYALEASSQFDGVELRVRRFNVDKWRVEGIQTFGGNKDKIDRIVLAGTLRNEVERRKRRVPRLPSHLSELRELIEWLLVEARTENWVFDEAVELAEAYIQMSAGDLEGYTLLHRVLQVRGDMAGELAMLQGIPDSGRGAAYRAQGLGMLKARLGLWADAEADLRTAVRLAPNDARPHAALADILRQRGRSREAAQLAELAEQKLGSVQGGVLRARIGTVIVACRLAVADLNGARAALAAIPRDHHQPFLDGCVHYAAGDSGKALAAFKQAASTADGGAALLGQAACQLRANQWQEAHDLLLQVVEREPLLRHRALTGLALLHCRLGMFDAALGDLDRALEAAPEDPYAFYLRGRTLRLLGQHAAAAEALTSALGLRDDFVHAIVEMSAVQAELAQVSADADRAPALVAARRFADRAVQLAPAPSVLLYELQGLRAFAAADWRAARAAFANARELASEAGAQAFAKGAIAVVDYSRGLVEDAATVLARLEQDLGRGDPFGSWAAGTLRAIEDHAMKELLTDGFDRTEVGTVWLEDNDGTFRARVADGQLVFRGRLSRAGDGEVGVARVGAIRRARSFLSCSVVLQLGADHPPADAFAGLGIEIERGSGGRDFQARVGVRDSRPFLRIEDGRDAADLQQIWIEVPGFDRRARHELELRVVPRGDESSRQLALQVRWNGALVHSHDLKQLTANTQNELRTVLFASGNKGSDLDVAFDDYRLERRKEAK